MQREVDLQRIKIGELSEGRLVGRSVAVGALGRAGESLTRAILDTVNRRWTSIARVLTNRVHFAGFARFRLLRSERS